MKTEYDNWDCEGSRKGVTRLRRRIGWIVLFLALVVGIFVILHVTSIFRLPIVP